MQLFLKIRLKIVLLRRHDVQFPFFLHDGKILLRQVDFCACGRWTFELVQLFLKMRLEIVVVHTHGV